MGEGCTLGMKSRWGFGAAVVWLTVLVMSGQAIAAAPQVRATKAVEVGEESATLEAELNPEGEETFYRFEYGTGDCAKTACTKIPVPDTAVPPGTSFVKVKKEVKGLTPNTLYHFRLVAHNATVVKGPDHTFITRGSAQVGLPDGRAYEQASPTEKNGDDAEGYVSMSKAAVDGNGVTFGSTFGIPSSAKGAQEFPFYTALRGSDWSTHGMLPPAELGERAYILGWLPDLSETFSVATKLASPPTEAFVVQDTASGTATLLTPYVAGAGFTYAGASADGSVILFESNAKLLPAASTGNNVYAYDTQGKALSLASRLNTQAESEAAVPKGAFAGPYAWGQGLNAGTLRGGGARAGSYLQDNRAVSEDGSVYFTAATTGQLYLRQNPTQAQSPINGEGNCTNPALACTIHVSASEKTNGKGGGPDPAGPAPAAFQAATAAGSVSFFTSPEMLTNDANTGIEQPKAAIVRDTLDGNPANSKGLISGHAIGLALEGDHIYWADPTSGMIGRATINPVSEEVESEDPHFIEPGETECETELETSPGHTEMVPVKAPTAPRYVAADSEHVYWTNTGPLSISEEPINDCGTIGRADLDGNETSVEPEYISEISNPQGVAVNATHIYWANAANEVQSGPRGIGRALIGDNPSSIEQTFFPLNADIPFGVAMDATHVYYSSDNAANGFSLLSRLSLEGEPQGRLLIRQHQQGGKAGIRGIALVGEDVYWAQGEEKAIGRAPVSALQPGECDEIPGCEREFVKKVEGSPVGLAADSTHLYWSVNGEASLNPGNDLYRFDVGAEAGKRLKDLTPLPSGSAPNGAEVQGVVGSTADGSHVYFTANGVLAAGATKGDCHSAGSHGSLGSLRGKCNLYLWQEGTISFVTRLDATGSRSTSDALNWAPASDGVFASGTFVARTAFTSADGQTLLFRSQEKLSAYDNEGTPELYRYRVGDAAIRCVSCNPAGEAAKEPPSLGSVTFAALAPRLTAATVSSRNLSADGNKAFFETEEALATGDINKAADVYEWEAPGSGSCTEANPSYSPINEGCIFLISTGTSPTFSQLIDASASGNDVFFLTRQQLVGQDKDELRDAYDARVGGGIASQNPQPSIPCESAGACHGPAQSPPAESAPSTQTFVGPGNPPVKHKKPKKHKAKKHKQAKHKKGKKKTKHQRAATKGRTTR